MKNQNKPAFPTVDTIHPRTGERHEPINLGLTKREYFAGLAMQGLLMRHTDRDLDIKDLTRVSVDFADELLKQLEP